MLYLVLDLEKISRSATALNGSISMVDKNPHFSFAVNVNDNQKQLFQNVANENSYKSKTFFSDKASKVLL